MGMIQREKEREKGWVQGDTKNKKVSLPCFEYPQNEQKQDTVDQTMKQQVLY